MRVRRISHTGVLIETERDLPEGTTVRLQLDVRGQPLRANAIVRDRQQVEGAVIRFAIGLQFDRLDEATRQLLDRLLNDLSGEEPLAACG